MAISTASESSMGRKLMTLVFAFVFVLTLALPAEAASATVTFNNTCKVKIENGSGAWLQNPWAKTTEIENCAQVRAWLRYWNGTQYTWTDSGWKSASEAFVQVTNVTDYERSQHGGRNVSGSGGRCIQMTKSGSLGSFFNC